MFVNEDEYSTAQGCCEEMARLATAIRVGISL